MWVVSHQNKRYRSFTTTTLSDPGLPSVSQSVSQSVSSQSASLLRHEHTAPVQEDLTLPFAMQWSTTASSHSVATYRTAVTTLTTSPFVWHNQQPTSSRRGGLRSRGRRRRRRQGLCRCHDDNHNHNNDHDHDHDHDVAPVEGRSSPMRRSLVYNSARIPQRPNRRNHSWWKIASGACGPVAVVVSPLLAVSGGASVRVALTDSGACWLVAGAAIWGVCGRVVVVASRAMVWPGRVATVSGISNHLRCKCKKCKSSR